jgi:Fe-S-cluster containining protein
MTHLSALHCNLLAARENCGNMSVDPAKVHHLAVLKEDENYRFRIFLKGRCDTNEEEIDRLVRELTDRVWAGIDCTTCANCCKVLQPTLKVDEMKRLAGRLGMAEEEFIATYLRPGEVDEKRWQIRGKPCPFLKDDRCSVYEDRPNDCRGYPYLHEPEFVFRTLGMIARTFVCPTVYEVMEELKPPTGFGRRR